jgi:hypothetical protein
MTGRILIIPTLILLISFSSALNAQTSSRIKFRRGAVTTAVAGTLQGYRSKRVYVIRVRGGQTLTTEQTGGRPITIYVKDPMGHSVGDSDASCNNRREISPTEAGNYRIEVVECRKADPWSGRFTFRVTVR